MKPLADIWARNLYSEEIFNEYSTIQIDNIQLNPLEKLDLYRILELDRVTKKFSSLTYHVLDSCSGVISEGRRK